MQVKAIVVVKIPFFFAILTCVFGRSKFLIAPSLLMSHMLVPMKKDDAIAPQLLFGPLSLTKENCPLPAKLEVNGHFLSSRHSSGARSSPNDTSSGIQRYSPTGFVGQYFEGVGVHRKTDFNYRWKTTKWNPLGIHHIRGE